ncbi:MAG TPA: GNAT family N-acetyltransferase, partial [Ilumatobacteraceae bacterium]|nr:GNAT family N-acetyltransferase [Ilumatobacteraceae bacterium]
MPIKFRTAEESDWEALCRVDGRNFGFGYTPEQIEKTRAIHDVSRFELGFDGNEIVAVVGVFTLQVTVPGARFLPMGVLTWVSTSATHRRQGLLTQLMARSLADVDR